MKLLNKYSVDTLFISNHHLPSVARASRHTTTAVSHGCIVSSPSPSMLAPVGRRHVTAVVRCLSHPGLQRVSLYHHERQPDTCR